MHSGGDLARAGVLLHTFDGLEDARRPWLPCPQEGDNSWCKRTADRVSASIVNHRVRGLHNAARGGLVLSSGVSLYCAFPADGDSRLPCCGLPCCGAYTRISSRAMSMYTRIRILFRAHLSTPAALAVYSLFTRCTHAICACELL